MTTLLNSERFVVEGFLKQADAALTFVETISNDGLARVVRSATARDPGEDYNEMLDTFFEAEQDFRDVKRAFRRMVRSVKAALEIDAELKDAEADRRSLEASVSERAHHAAWTVDAALSSLVEKYRKETRNLAVDALRPYSFCAHHFGSLRGKDEWKPVGSSARHV